MHKQPEEIPEILYKYLPGNRALQALPAYGNGTLRATQPAALNDPLECTTQCTAVYPSDDDEIQEIAETLNWIVPDHTLTKSDIRLSLQQLGTQAWNELFRKQLSRRFGIVSFSSGALHPLLWSHYADSGAGVVVGYRTSILKKIPKGYERLEAVKYYDKPTISCGHTTFKDVSNLHITLLEKAHYWKYEQEWRLTLELKNTVGTNEIDSKGHPVNICPIPNEAVAEVYFTERTPQSTVEIIKAWLDNNGSRFDAKVPRKLVLSPDEYGYKA